MIASGVVSNTKLGNPFLSVNAGTGLAGGGQVALGSTTTVSVANGGIGSTQLADGAVTTEKVDSGATAPNAAQLGGIMPSGYVQGPGTLYSGHPDSTPAAGAKTIFAIPNMISVAGECTSSGGNSDVFIEDGSSGNVFAWKVVAGQAATSLTLTPFDPMNRGADTDFGPVTPVSQVTWQGTTAAGSFLVVASAYSHGSICHFNGWGIRSP